MSGQSTANATTAGAFELMPGETPKQRNRRQSDPLLKEVSFDEYSGGSPPALEYKVPSLDRMSSWAAEPAL